MTKVILDGPIKGLRGKIGNLIFRQLPDGTIVMSQAPAKKNRREKKRAKLKRSARQQAHNSRFKEAVIYAKVAQRRPIYADLAAVTPMTTAYGFALSDWLKPPEIHSIERKEGRILVEASDNVLVTKVHVTLLDDQGSVLEKGEAVRGEGDWWGFAFQMEGAKILAEAWDMAGNVTKSES